MQNYSDLSENISTSFFYYIIIWFLYLTLYLWKLLQKSSNFNICTWIFILSEIIYKKTFSFIRKCLHFHFHLYSDWICMPFIVSEILSKTSSIFQYSYVIHFIICKLWRCKSSELAEYVFTSFFNFILIVFVCLSLTLSFFLNKYSILLIILCNPQSYHTYIRWKSSVLS